MKAEPGADVGIELARLLAGYVCLHAAMAGMRMAAPLLALNQGYDKEQVGLLVALFSATQIFLSLPAGRLADRRGLKLLVGWSVTVASVGAGIAAIWPIYHVLCASALLTGGAVGAASIAIQRHVGRAAQTSRQLKQVFSWLSIAPAGANFLGPFAAGLVIDHAGYRTAFLMLASLPLVAWLWARVTRELPNQHPHRAESETAWNLWRSPGFRRLLLMNWFVSASWDVHAFLVPVIGHERGIPASVIGTILGAFAVAAAVSRFAMPFIAARLHEWVLITGAMVVAALLFGLYPFTQSPLSMGLCSAAIGVALGMVQPIVMSILHQITPSHRHGQAVAMRTLMINASGVAMPLLFGVAGGVLGAAGVFWMMGLVVGLGSRLGPGLRDIDKDDSGQ